jgi:hypothetical protein
MDGQQQQSQDQWQMGNVNVNMNSMNSNTGGGLQSWQMENQRRLAASKVKTRRSWMFLRTFWVTRRVFSGK